MTNAEGREQARDALDKLAALGTPRRIADHLAELGVTGVPGHFVLCPLVMYLWVVLPRPNGIAVTHGTWSFGFGEFERLPEPVATFVQCCDARWFPELVCPENLDDAVADVSAVADAIGERNAKARAAFWAKS